MCSILYPETSYYDRFSVKNFGLSMKMLGYYLRTSYKAKQSHYTPWWRLWGEEV
jgi:hypothetical protein